MKTITEIQRLQAPAKMPQSLAWDGDSLWMGSLATKKIYHIDPRSWSVTWQCDAPGLPFGMVVVNNELRVLCGETDQDNRIVRRCIPNHGFDTVYALPCPDDTGSQLSWDGKNLHVSQWYNQRILALSEEGDVEKHYHAPRGICGQTIVDNDLYILNTADEETDDYVLSRIDRQSGACQDLAKVPFPARSLAFDGEAFWTNHRAAGETVRFAAP
ncbi:hypothetical protein [Pelagicoccus sp. SDUM812003]|uniref:hypothetical protein n=1 Tax=Pelagicoccus sp. SDUM812003 TaxID=3041267 RepID=UPI00280C7F1B|nr:hypothetical protein [Pelagicoccus sp. SDUM812003]MDQ8205262.1 hypothetical protein [Pelagicoccus sp. SDUM812003]